MIGDSVKNLSSGKLSELLNYDDPNGLASQYLADKGLEIVSTASPESILNYLIKGVAPPSDLVALKYTQTAIASPQSFSASGSLPLFAGSSPLSISGSANEMLQPRYEPTSLLAWIRSVGCTSKRARSFKPMPSRMVS